MDELESTDQLEDQITGNAPAASPKLSFSVATRDAFFARVTSQLKRSVPDELGGFTARPMFNLMKVAYRNERVHYEVGIDLNHAVLEIALHFEDGPVSTLQYLAYLDRRIVELKDVLGHTIELERWTASWGRVYELWPLERLDRGVADRVATRLSEYIVTLQPLLETANIRPERSAQPRGAPRTFKRSVAR